MSEQAASPPIKFPQVESTQARSASVLSPKIDELFVYPIKSCTGISVSHFQFDHRGPMFDRRWMLVDAETGVFLSQREIPQMALITTYIKDDSVWAGVRGDEQACLLPVDGVVVDVSVWSDDVQGLDCGDKAAGWFSAILEYDCRLIFQGDCERLADTEYAEAGTDVSYADGFPLLVVSRASIQFLNAECDAEIGAGNFRPNVVITNTDVFAEVKWQSLMTDSISMNVVKPCERCVIPALNPKTGVREKSILPVLIKHCRRDKKIYFGQNLTFKPLIDRTLNSPLQLRVGHDVVITADI